MGRRHAWVFMVGLMLAGGLAGVAQPVRAQGRPLSVVGLQDLAFGTVFPGVAVTISRTDAALGGQFEVRGARDAEVRIDLLLPAAMTTSGGVPMTMTFGAGDGGYSQTQSVGTAAAFDPNAPLTARLNNKGRLYIYLGGRITPAPQQPSGIYSATLTLQVAYTGA